MKNDISLLLKTMTVILTSKHTRAKQARTLILVHLILQGVLLTTIWFDMQELFYVMLTVFLFITVKIIVHGLHLHQKR